MNDHKKYLFIIAGLFVLILSVILLDLDEDKSDNNTKLWDEDWAAVEYSNYRLLKERSLLTDDYYVLKKISGSDRKPLKREGSYIIANIFNYWNRPGVKGIYDVNMMDSIKGESVSEKEIRFYKAKDDTSFTSVKILKRMPSHDRVIKVENHDKEDQIFILGSEYFSFFTTYETNFYEKRLFLYPSSSFSENVRIQFQNLNGRKESLDLSQSRTKSEMNLVQVWTDDKNNEIPKHLAETLDTGLRQLQISTFGDEEGDFTGIENQWNLPGDEIHITVKMKDAGNKEIRIKKISHHQNRMILVQHGDFIDHCVPEQIERLEKAAEALIEHRNVYIEKSSKSSSGLKNSEQNP